MGVTQFFSNKQHTYFFFLKMPEFKDMMASGKNGWTSWWAFNFWIAQAFHLMYFNGFAFWDTSLAETRAVMAFNIIGFLAFFMVPIAHFITGCNMTKKNCDGSWSFSLFGFNCYLYFLGIYCHWCLVFCSWMGRMGQLFVRCFLCFHEQTRRRKRR